MMDTWSKHERQFVAWVGASDTVGFRCHHHHQESNCFFGLCFPPRKVVSPRGDTTAQAAPHEAQTSLAISVETKLLCAPNRPLSHVYKIAGSLTKTVFVFQAQQSKMRYVCVLLFPYPLELEWWMLRELCKPGSDLRFFLSPMTPLTTEMKPKLKWLGRIDALLWALFFPSVGLRACAECSISQLSQKNSNITLRSHFHPSDHQKAAKTDI